MKLLGLLAAFFGATAFAAEARFGYAELRKLIDDQKLASVDALLKALPASMKKRGRVGILYKSRSDHRGTWERPRMVFSTPGSELLVAVSGDENDPLYHRVETIEYKRSGRVFLAKSIDFPADEKLGITAIKDDVEGKDCRTCHRQREWAQLPNWDTYRTTPGVFGSISESEIDVERKKFSTFAEAAEKLPRYEAVRPLLREAVTSKLLLEALHIEMGFELAWLHFDWFSHQLEHTPDFEKYRFAFYAVYRHCSKLVPLDTFVPAAVKAELDRGARAFLTAQQYAYDGTLSGLANMVAATKAAQENYLKVRNERTEEYLGTRLSEQELENTKNVAVIPQHIAAVRYLVEGRGISMVDWFTPKGISYSTVEGRAGWFGNKKFNALPAIVAALEARQKAKNGDEGQLLECTQLRDASLAAFAKPAP